MLFLREAMAKVPEKIYGAAETPDKFIFFVSDESPMTDKRTVDKKTGKLGWLDFDEWVSEVDSGKVTRLSLNLQKAS